MRRLSSSVASRQLECLEDERELITAAVVDRGWKPLDSKSENSGAKRWRLLLTLAWALGIGVGCAPQAKAAFIGNYSLNNATLVNTDLSPGAATDGSVMTPDNGQSIVLTGGNSGSGLPGLTDLLFTAAGSGPVQFSYFYSSLDIAPNDFAGYLLGSAFTQLANSDGQSGTAMFTVSSGQQFGFRVGTLDNEFEPGILTISDFSAPAGGGGGAVPEPATGLMMLLATTVAIAVGRRVNLTR